MDITTSSSQNEFDESISVGKTLLDSFITISVKGLEDKKVEFSFTKEDLDNVFNRFAINNRISERKESLCITAIKNLVKKNDFLQLSLNLAEDIISEEEFEKELESDSEKYTVKMHEQATLYDIHIIGNILHKVGGNFSVDEAAEMFSLDTHSLSKNVKALYP